LKELLEVIPTKDVSMLACVDFWGGEEMGEVYGEKTHESGGDGLKPDHLMYDDLRSGRLD